MGHTDAGVFFFIALGTAMVTVYPNITDVGLDTFYSCMSEETLAAASVNQTLWNVLIQAFVSNGTLGKNRKCTQNHHQSGISVFSLLT